MLTNKNNQSVCRCERDLPDRGRRSTSSKKEEEKRVETSCCTFISGSDTSWRQLQCHSITEGEEEEDEDEKESPPDPPTHTKLTIT